MDRRVLMGLILGVLGVGLVIGIAFGLLHVLDRDQDGDDRELMGNSITLDLDKINAGACCQKIRVSGTTNNDEFYQEMMGDYYIYNQYPWINYTKLDYDNLVTLEGSRQSFPVYQHAMWSDSDNPKFAYLYYFNNVESRHTEVECPEGCWMLGMYDMTPGNYWWGKKWYYLKKDPGVDPPQCPDNLSDNGAKFTNQQSDLDQGLTLECVN